jgi:hypothetical protein
MTRQPIVVPPEPDAVPAEVLVLPVKPAPTGIIIGTVRTLEARPFCGWPPPGGLDDPEPFVAWPPEPDDPDGAA